MLKNQNGVERILFTFLIILADFIIGSVFSNEKTINSPNLTDLLFHSYLT